jgi:Sec-independent protein translocase protein TatA
VGFGTEILFILLLGLLVMGPKRLHALLADVARAKTRFEEASRGFKSQLTAELEAASQRSPLLATENVIEPAQSGSLGCGYEITEGGASQQSSRQEIRV